MNSSDNQRDTLGGLMVLGSGASGAGCLTIILILGAIFLGQQLDRWFGTEPWLLLTLLLISIPLSLFMMVRSALSAARTAEYQYAARQRMRRLDDDRAPDETTDTQDLS